MFQADCTFADVFEDVVPYDHWDEDTGNERVCYVIDYTTVTTDSTGTTDSTVSSTDTEESSSIATPVSAVNLALLVTAIVSLLGLLL